MKTKNTIKTLKDHFNFQIALRFEVFYALQVLSDSESRIHGKWKKKAIKALPTDFIQTNGNFLKAPNLWPILADTLQTLPLDLSYKEIISHLKKMDIQSFQREILLGAIHYPELVDALLRKSKPKEVFSKIPKKKREWLAFIGLYPFQSGEPLVELVKKLLISPEKFRKQVIQVIEVFWISIFQKTWKQIQPQLEQSLDLKQKVFEASTLNEFAKEALLRIEFDESKKLIRAIRGGDTISFDKVEKGHIFPSLFNDKRYWTAFDHKKKSFLYIPYFEPSISLELEVNREQEQFLGPELDPALIFRALGDTTRYAMISLIAESSKTSLELSKLLSVSKPTISHHLHILREAGLVNEQSKSGCVYLSVKRETIEGLSNLFLKKLFSNKSQKIKISRSRK